jgi:hypothetical protein
VLLPLGSIVFLKLLIYVVAGTTALFEEANAISQDSFLEVAIAFPDLRRHL